MKKVMIILSFISIKAIAQIGPNLIVNGDFSGGNVGFSSGMNYSSVYTPCDYDVGPIWFTINYNMQDHTSTNDNMFMSLDGCTSVTTIWQETIAGLQPNTAYHFSFWASRADQVQPTFELHFIGNVSGDNVMQTVTGIPYTGVFTWDEYCSLVWNTGSNNSLTIKLVNLETNSYGNDFGMDDFTFQDTARQDSTYQVVPCQDTLADFALNVFTPNADGMNDRLIFPDQGATAFDCQIYDRWGELVAEITDPLSGWNGKSRSGNECSAGVYYYIVTGVDFCGNGFRKTGFVELIR